jgi:hypothetical protein
VSIAEADEPDGAGERNGPGKSESPWSPTADSPSPTRDHVRTAIAQAFPSEDPAMVLGILDRYGQERHERKPERVHLAILALSRGDLDELRTLVTCAKRDYRDVLYWTELAKGYSDPYADRFLEALLTPEATPTRLALLKEAVPAAARVAVLWNPGYVSHKTQMAELLTAAQALAVILQPIAVRRPNQLDGAFTAIPRGQVEALLILTSTMLQYHWWGGPTGRGRTRSRQWESFESSQRQAA